MRILLIGHRSCGKTSLLRRLSSRPGLASADLGDDADALIRALGAYQGKRAVLAAGAGAVVDLAGFASPVEAAAALRARAVFHNWTVVWVRRDAPLPDGAAARREVFYASAADSVLTVPEGMGGPRVGCPWEQAEAAVIGGRPPPGAGLAIFPVTSWDGAASELERWGSRGELRDDLLSRDELLTWARVLGNRAVLACRDQRRRAATEAAWQEGGGFLDLPDEFPHHPASPVAIRTFMTRTGDETLSDVLARASETFAGLSRVVVEVRGFAELAEGHAWAEAAPERRAFLPESPDGRWAWYRLVAPGLLPMVRRGRGTCRDQPTIMEWAAHRLCSSLSGRWAASIGAEPSRTFPVDRAPFWAARGLPALRVSVEEGEDFAFVLAFLEKLGLGAAALVGALAERLGYSALLSAGGGRREWRRPGEDAEALWASCWRRGALGPMI